MFGGIKNSCYIWQVNNIYTGRMAIFDRLVELRKEKRISQRNMAIKLGMKAGRLNRYEKGDRKISIEFVEDYADKLGYEIRLMVK
jgi:transcriptional regulator with XRE-family HTH domain